MWYRDIVGDAVGLALEGISELTGINENVLLVASMLITRKAPKGKIKGYTKHGLNQKITREVKSSDVLSAVKKPLKTGDVKTDNLGRASQRHTGNKAEVVINPTTGDVVSVNPTSTKKASRLKKQQK